MADFRSKRLKSIKLKACLVCFLSLGTLFAAGTATFAWFTTNKQASAQYLNIVAQDTHMVFSVEYYAIENVDTEKGTYTFNTTSQTHKMPKYDRVYNDEKNKLLIKINLKANHEAFTVKATAEGNNTPKEDGEFDWGKINWNANDKGSYNFPLSTIVKFDTCDLVSEVKDSSITVKKTNPTNEMKFVDASESTPKFTTTLSPLASGAASTSTVYIMVDYNEKAVEAIYSYNIGNSIFDNEAGSSDSSGDTSNTIKWTLDFVITVVPGSN